MRENRHQILKSSFGVAVATLLSRILGLARVMLEARVLGGGGAASAWGFAFMLPNIFRRLLGEGALGSALIPLISHQESTYGAKKMRLQLGAIFIVLGAILAVIVILVAAFAWFFQDYFTTPYIRLAMQLTPVVMPYSFFICIIGVAGALLNTRRVFFLPALGALLLNIFLIGALGLFYHYGCTDMTLILQSLSKLVLLSGVLHLAMMLILMYYYRIMPSLSLQSLREHKVIGELFHLALPGLIGASALQVSLLIDRALALSLGAEALPALNYTERIVYLPVGIFAISIGSVLMADMSRAAANKNYEEMIDDMIFSLRHVSFICVPMMIFVIVFRNQILGALFLDGNFNESNLKATAWATLFYTMGVPFFCATKVITPAFYARKQMMVPMKISLVAIVANVVLNLILMFPLQQGGLALATVLSAMLNNALLLYYLKKDGFVFSLAPVHKVFVKALIASLIASLLYFSHFRLAAYIGGGFVLNVLLICMEMVIFAIIYMLLMFLMRSIEINETFSLLKRRKRK